MNYAHIKVALVLKELGIHPDEENFRKIKNAIYLTQAAGIETGNYFFWWHYSGTIGARRLSEDFFMISTLVDLPSGITNQWDLDEKSKKRLSDLKPILEFSDLELLTSTHFLIVTGNAKTTSEIQEILNRYGRDYTEKQIQNGISLLKSYRLL